jgi:hypothetical protein
MVQISPNGAKLRNNIPIRYVRDIHNYNTRQTNYFYINNYQTDSYDFENFYRRGLIKFNELNSTLQNIVTLSEFKSAIRTHLYNNYN